MIHSYHFLTHTALEVEKLLKITREYSKDHSEHDRALLVGEARMAYTVVLSNIALKLLHCKRWLEKMRDVVSDQSAGITTGAPEYPLLVQLHDYALNDEALHGYLPKILVTLSRLSLQIYRRIQRLDEQIHDGVTAGHAALENQSGSYENVVLLLHRPANNTAAASAPSSDVSVSGSL